VTSSIAPAGPTPATLIRIPATLSGGAPNLLSSIGLTHCTLVPGWVLTPDGDPQFGAQPSIIGEPAGVRLVIAKSIVGAIRTHELAMLSVTEESSMRATPLTWPTRLSTEPPRADP